jgi:hypothetical protein
MLVGYTESSTYTIPFLNENTTYDITVKAIDFYGNTSPSIGMSITTSDSHPKPKMYPSNYDVKSYIKQVSLITTHRSGYGLIYPAIPRATPIANSTYNDFTATSGIKIPTFIIGSKKNVQKVSAIVDGFLDAHVTSYIDYNNNNNFEPNEIITGGGLTYKGGNLSMSNGVPVTFISNDFSVPSSVNPGRVRMRIIYERRADNKYSTTQPNPYDFGMTGKGEIQDFMVLLQLDPSLSGRVANKDTKQIEEIDNIKTTSIKDPTELTIYPNPVSGDIMNITAVKNNSLYSVYNKSGIEVSKGNVSDGTINVSKLTKGNYILQVQVDNQTIVKQFIKQ